ncbi:MAG: response regulator, partial [Opitutaceae bacterium]
ILIVDDEESVRVVASATLRRMGYEVLVTEDGAAAVKLVASHPGPLNGVLLDVTMPGMDGAATLQELRRMRPDLKAILMSGYDEQASLRRFQDLGVGNFLHKPFSAEALGAHAAAWD